MVLTDFLLALVPLIPAFWLCLNLLDGNPMAVLQKYIQHLLRDHHHYGDRIVLDHDLALQSQLLAYISMAVAGYVITSRLVPGIQEYTLRKGIAGKDLGKRGTKEADNLMYVHNVIYLYIFGEICLSLSHVLFFFLFFYHFFLDRRRWALFPAPCFWYV
jgi:hypothetical protein